MKKIKIYSLLFCLLLVLFAPNASFAKEYTECANLKGDKLKQCIETFITKGDREQCRYKTNDQYVYENKDRCLRKYAIEQEDVKFCFLIEGNTKSLPDDHTYGCFRHFAETNNENYCEFIKYNEYIGDCFKYVASEKKDPSICENLPTYKELLNSDREHPWTYDSQDTCFLKTKIGLFDIYKFTQNTIIKLVSAWLLLIVMAIGYIQIHIRNWHRKNIYMLGGYSISIIISVLLSYYFYLFRFPFFTYLFISLVILSIHTYSMHFMQMSLTNNKIKRYTLLFLASALLIFIYIIMPLWGGNRHYLIWDFRINIQAILTLSLLIPAIFTFTKLKNYSNNIKRDRILIILYRVIFTTGFLIATFITGSFIIGMGALSL